MGTVLSLCTPQTSSHLQKYSDDSAVVGYFSDGHEAGYRKMQEVFPENSTSERGTIELKPTNIIYLTLLLFYNMVKDYGQVFKKDIRDNVPFNFLLLHHYGWSPTVHPLSHRSRPPSGLANFCCVLSELAAFLSYMCFDVCVACAPVVFVIAAFFSCSVLLLDLFCRLQRVCTC